MRKILFTLLLAFALTSCSTSGDNKSSNPEDQSYHPPNEQQENIADVPEVILNPCSSRPELQLCIKNVINNEQGTQVIIEAQLMDTSIQLAWPIIPSDYPQADHPFVFMTDGLGMVYEFIQEKFLPEPGDMSVEGSTVEQTLIFPSLQPGATSVMVHIPAIVVEAPIQGSIEIDLGLNPAPGSIFNPATSIGILGNEVRFDYAEIDDQRNLHVYSAPIDLEDDVIVRWLFAGMPEGWTSSVGPGNKYNFESRIQHLWFPIPMSNGQTASGDVSIPVFSALLYLTGPFEMSFPIQ